MSFFCDINNTTFVYATAQDVKEVVSFDDLIKKAGGLERLAQAVSDNYGKDPAIEIYPINASNVESYLTQLFLINEQPAYAEEMPDIRHNDWNAQFARFESVVWDEISDLLLEEVA